MIPSSCLSSGACTNVPNVEIEGFLLICLRVISLLLFSSLLNDTLFTCKHEKFFGIFLLCDFDRYSYRISRSFSNCVMYVNLLTAASLCAVVFASPHLDRREDADTYVL